MGLSPLQREVYAAYLGGESVKDVLRGKVVSPLAAISHLKKARKRCTHKHTRVLSRKLYRIVCDLARIDQKNSCQIKWLIVHTVSSLRQPSSFREKFSGGRVLDYVELGVGLDFEVKIILSFFFF